MCGGGLPGPGAAYPVGVAAKQSELRDYGCAGGVTPAPLLLGALEQWARPPQQEAESPSDPQKEVYAIGIAGGMVLYAVVVTMLVLVSPFERPSGPPGPWFERISPEPAFGRGNSLPIRRENETQREN